MKSVFVALVLLAMLGSAGLAVVCHGAGEADARSAVSQADARVSTCYLAVADAEKAGANVSGLLVTLNNAGMLLSEAHLSLINGSYDLASGLADQCMTMLSGFDNAASSLEASASHAALVDFWVNVVGSGVGAIAVVVGGFFLWRFLKRKSAIRAGAV